LDETVAQAPNPAPRRRAGPLAAVTAAAVAVEGLLLLAVAVRLSVELASAAPADTGGAAAEVVLCVLFGLGLLGCAWAVSGGRRWPRGLLLTWQLLQTAAAIPALGERWYVGAGLLLLAAVVVVGLVRGPRPAPAGPEAG
jgi:hypothetical protein